MLIYFPIRRALKQCHITDLETSRACTFQIRSLIRCSRSVFDSRTALSSRSPPIPISIMVTGTYAISRGYPNDSTTWPLGIQNTYSNALNAPRPQNQEKFASNPRYTVPHHSILANSEVSGYLHSHGKARDHHHGKYLERILLAKDINIETAPPFEQVTEKLSFTNHGVVKINNVCICPCRLQACCRVVTSHN